jgi:hypothetical protein
MCPWYVVWHGVRWLLSQKIDTVCAPVFLIVGQIKEITVIMAMEIN